MKNFFETKGFYIVLAICVTSIGVAGYVNFSSDDNETLSSSVPEIVLPVIEETVKVPEEEVVHFEEKTYVPSVEVVVPTVKEEPMEVAKDTEVKVETTKPSETLYISPVEKAVVIQENSNNELVKDLTMNDWRTHSATDYEVSPGDYILAIANGVVLDIYTTDLHATTIVIEHDEGLVTKTVGLNADTLANVGDKVYAGDVIGTAIGEIVFEQKLGNHIHVEATLNGENIDIEKLINGD